MCGQMNRCGSRRGVRQAPAPDNGCCCCCCRPCQCDCGCQSDVPTATISMADYQPFILVPTTVFDQGDVDCGCATGFDW